MHGTSIVRAGSVQIKRRSWGRSIAAMLAVGAIVAGLALVFIPYSRSLVGDVDGSREVAGAECGVPLVEALAGSGTRSLTANGTWIDGPPCGHSSRYRVALGALLLAGGAYVLVMRTSRRGRVARYR